MIIITNHAEERAAEREIDIHDGLNVVEQRLSEMPPSFDSVRVLYDGVKYACKRDECGQWILLSVMSTENREFGGASRGEVLPKDARGSSVPYKAHRRRAKRAQRRIQHEKKEFHDAKYG